MKKIHLVIVTSLIFLIVSCQKDHEIETYDLGTEFFISDNGYTTLDNSVTFTIENQQKNLSEIKMIALEITDDDDNIITPPNNEYNISLENGSGSITLTSAQLGIDKIGWSEKFSFKSSFEGKSIERFADITVENPISLTPPYIWAPNDDGDIVETPVTVYQNSDVQYIKYHVDPAHTSVETITIETKVNEGNYTVVSGSFNPASDSLAVTGSDYNAKDTVYFKFTATSGALEQTDELNFIVNTVEFANTGGAKLDSTSTVGFDLVNNQIVPSGSDTTDLKLTRVALTSIGFVSENGTQFVASNEQMFKNNDIIATKAAFAAGTPQNSFPNVVAGDVFIYKTMREDEEHYGIIKITAAFLASNGMDDYLEFIYLY